VTDIAGSDQEHESGVLVRLLTWWIRGIEPTAFALRGEMTDGGETSVLMRAMANEFWV
jgi:hypothetical protein